MSSALTPLFPAAMRTLNALREAHGRAPVKLDAVAHLLEESIQAYGRCLLASAGTPVLSGDGHIAVNPSDVAVREAENHMMWRQKLRAAVDSVSLGDARLEQAVHNAMREVDHLAYTMDKVFAARNIHCSTVSSGVHA